MCRSNKCDLQNRVGHAWWLQKISKQPAYFKKLTFFRLSVKGCGDILGPLPLGLKTSLKKLALNIIFKKGVEGGPSNDKSWRGFQNPEKRYNVAYGQYLFSSILPLFFFQVRIIQDSRYQMSD